MRWTLLAMMTLLVLPAVLVAWVPVGGGSPPAATGLDAGDPLGSWAFTMEGSSVGVLTGTMTIAAEAGGSRLTVPGSGVDAPIQDQQLEISGDSFELRGQVDRYMMLIRATVEGDEMTGSNDVTGIGTLSLTARRIVAS